MISGADGLGEVISINVSKSRGTEKVPVEEINLIQEWGLEGDAHGGDWDRQVSIFPVEALEKVPEENKDEVLNGGYTENFTIKGIALKDLTSGTKLKVGNAIIQVLQIGKEKYEDHGRPFIVSREGRFGRVIKGGKVKTGDKIYLITAN